MFWWRFQSYKSFYEYHMISCQPLMICKSLVPLVNSQNEDEHYISHWYHEDQHYWEFCRYHLFLGFVLIVIENQFLALYHFHIILFDILRKKWCMLRFLKEWKKEKKRKKNSIISFWTLMAAVSKKDMISNGFVSRIEVISGQSCDKYKVLFCFFSKNDWFCCIFVNWTF